MGRVLPILLILVAGVAIAAAGPEAWGRLALRAGWPGVAARLIETPRWDGVALYRAGRYPEADDAFARAGLGSTYNRANSLATTGNYQLSVEYYDSVLYVDGSDADAHANRAYVATLFDPHVGVANDIDGMLATVAVPDAPAVEGTFEQQIQARMRNRPRLARPEDSEQSVAASERWLRSLPDDPGRYLKLRIAAERKRRMELGAAVWQGGDPW